jgi:hypothetical protein
MAVLAGFSRGERRQRPDWETEVEGDAVEVTGADASARQDEETVLRESTASIRRSGAAASDERPQLGPRRVC